MTNITDQWSKLSFDGKVGFVEMRKEQRCAFPDPEYDRFKEGERARRQRIRKHTDKILAMRRAS
jgi:hypothetical protein